MTVALGSMDSRLILHNLKVILAHKHGSKIELKSHCDLCEILDWIYRLIREHRKLRRENENI